MSWDETPERTDNASPTDPSGGLSGALESEQGEKKAGKARARSHRPGGRAAEMPPLSYLGKGRVELGEFHVRVFNPADAATLETEFRLEGQTVCEDQASFEDFLRANHRFVREQVAVGLRACRAGELLDPDLPLLQRKLVSRVNRALGRKFLKSLDIKDYAVYESRDHAGFTPVVGQVTSQQHP